MNRLILLPVLALVLPACRSRDRYDERASESATSRSPSWSQERATSPSYKAPSQAKNLSQADRDFVEKAVRGGFFEVESSRVALRKTSSQGTREFAEMMISDHGKANRELEMLAGSKGLYFPSQLDPEHQQVLDELEKLEGTAFDNRYIQEQVRGHDEAIRLFENASRECQDPDLRDFASRTLPKLREHRSHLDKMPAPVGG